MWIGGAIGQALAFLLARYLLRDWVEATLRGRWRKWEVLDRAIEHDGWKLVLIMRMSPIIPYNLLNIAMATTSMPFWQVRQKEGGCCGGWGTPGGEGGKGYGRAGQSTNHTCMTPHQPQPAISL